MTRTLVAIVLAFTGSGSALALDLKKAKLPVEYECRMSLTTSLYINKDGVWSSGPIGSSRQPFRFLLERFESVQNEKNRKSCELSKKSSKFSLGDEYCWSALLDGYEGGAVGVSYFCTLTLDSLAKKDNAVLSCGGDEYIFDTDRGNLVSTLNTFPFGTPSVVVSKSDCVRLDR